MKDFLLGHGILRVETTLFEIFVPLCSLHTAQHGGEVPRKGSLINDHHKVGNFPSHGWNATRLSKLDFLTELTADKCWRTCTFWKSLPWQWKCLNIIKTPLKKQLNSGKLQQSAYWLQFPKATIQLQFFLLLVIFKEIMSLNPQNKRWMILIQGLTK